MYLHWETESWHLRPRLFSLTSTTPDKKCYDKMLKKIILITSVSLIVCIFVLIHQVFFLKSLNDATTFNETTKSPQEKINQTLMFQDINHLFYQGPNHLLLWWQISVKSQTEFRHFAGVLMEHFLEGIALLRHLAH